MSNKSDRLVALVTGANRGLGRETVRQLIVDHGYAVVLSARSLAKAQQAAHELKAEVGGDAVLEPVELDVSNAQQAKKLAAFVEARFGRLDTLVNNAGALVEKGWPSILETNVDDVRETLEINTISALTVSQAFVPLLLKGNGGNIVMVSSGMGGLTEMGSHHLAYRLSKTGMNVLTRTLHGEFAEQGLRINSVCPGFVKTEFSPANVDAEREIPEGAKGIVWAATLDEKGPSGGFFRDGEAILW